MNRRQIQTAMIGVLLVSWGLLMGGTVASGAETPADFYRGKNILWISTGDAGAPGDLTTRTIAPFLAKALGAKVKVENRKADEGVNYVYSQGTRDGLTLGTNTSAAIIGSDILKAPGIQYDTNKLNFVADVYPTLKMLQISPKLPYKTLEALKKAKGLRAGATSAKGAIAVSSAVVMELLGLDGKVITGFKGKKELTIAIARGEIDFMVTSDNGAMKDEKDGFVVNLLVVGDKRSEAVPHVPALLELGVKIPREMASAYKFVTSGGTSVFLPPGVARERLEYLRKEFQVLSNNTELQKELEKITADRRPFVSGQELQEEMAEIKSDKELAAKLDAIFKKYSAVR